MFLRPFLKYFRPYLWRILVAVFGMVMVGALATAPVVFLGQVIHVLDIDTATHRGKGTKAEKDDAAGGITDIIRNPTSALNGGKGEKGPKNEKDPESEIKQTINKELESRFGERYTSWLKLIKERKEAISNWYDRKIEANRIGVLGVLVGMLLVLVALKGLAEFSSKYQLAYTFFLTSLKIREDIYSNILRQDYIFFSRNSPGYLHSRITSDVKAVSEIIESLLSEGVQQPITIIFMFSVLLWISPPLTLAVLVILPAVAGLLYYFARVLRKNTSQQKRQADKLSSGLTESLNNIRLVKAFGTEKIEIHKFHEQTMAIFRYLMARRVAKFGSSPTLEFLGVIAFGGTVLAGGWMLLENYLSFKYLVMFMYTLSRFYRPMRSLAMLTQKFQNARVSTERMSEMLNLQPRVNEAADPRPFERIEREIEFQNVGFDYGAKRVLSDIVMSVPAEQCIALVGASGSGKTTLVNLLARLFDPTEGKILVDGVDLRQLRVREWRSRLAIVTQETFLFDDTILNNITYGAEGPVDPERVRAAAEAANAHEFIMRLQGGQDYQTAIGPAGVRLSGGQRQRLAIARAIYRNPQILILDEATSALDEQSQALVQEAMTRLMTGRTTVVIAHRLSTIRHSDCIYVLDHGRIVERGTHAELMALEGVYAEIARTAGMHGDQLPASPEYRAEEEGLEEAGAGTEEEAGSDLESEAEAEVGSESDEDSDAEGDGADSDPYRYKSPSSPWR